MRARIQNILITSLIVAAYGTLYAEELAWSQYRGPNGSGIADDATPPLEFGPEKNVRWKTEIPTGVSSPVIAGNKIFITALENRRLMTLCYDRNSGKELWRRLAPAVPLENFHQYANQASSTPVTDGENVFVYFGSFGLLAYTVDGKELWTRKFATPPTMFGTGTSPVLYKNTVILQRDGDFTESGVIAMDTATGETKWESKRPAPGGSYSTPFIWNHDGDEELIVIGKGMVSALDPNNGVERWHARGMTFSPHCDGRPLAVGFYSPVRPVPAARAIRWRCRLGKTS